MQNKKRGAFLSSTNEGNNYRLNILYLILSLGLLLVTCNKQTSQNVTEVDIELEMLQKGSTDLENGKYDQAQLIYSRFISQYPEHPYVDDAAYRLAYISVIADEKNPYFNYKNGLVLFQKFDKSPNYLRKNY